jgi:drug/metabolite transporter (DMT)-like permease
VPVYAVVFGWMVLGEPLSWRLLAALAFILTGIAASRLSFAANGDVK